MAKYDGIYKRPDGRFCYDLYTGQKTASGRPHKRQIYGRSKAEVYEKAQKARDELAGGVDPKRSRQSVEAFLLYWLERYVKRDNAESTYVQQLSYCKNHIIPAIGSIVLAELRTHHVNKMLDELQPHKRHTSQRKAPSPISGNTRRIVRNILRRALNIAIAERLITVNPAATVSIDTDSDFEAHPLNESEARRLLETIEEHRQRALYLCYVSMGFRRGELLNVRWSHIDFDTMTLRVTGSWGRVQGKLRTGNTKTSESKQALPIPPFVGVALLEHKERLINEGNYKDDGFVFVTEKGTPLEPRNVNRQFKAILKQAGLSEEIRIHDLRHTCGSLLAAKQVDQRTIMRLLRHTQMSTTARYMHPYEEAQRRAFEGLGDVFKKKEE